MKSVICFYFSVVIPNARKYGPEQKNFPCSVFSRIHKDSINAVDIEAKFKI